MTDSSSSPEAPRGADATAGVLVDFDQAALRKLAEAASIEEFAAIWLDLQGKHLGGVSSAAVVFERTAGEPMAAVAAWPRGSRDISALAPAIERAVKERRGVVMRGAEERHLLAFPILAGSKLHGVAAFDLSHRSEPHLLSAMRQLQWGISWLQNWVLRQTAWPEAHLKHRLTTTLEMAALVLEVPEARSAATAFLTEMATRFDCDRVSLGILKGKHVKVQALSHSADFTRQMNLIRAIGQAMSESLDQQAVLVFPAAEGDGGRVLRAHEDLARSHGDAAICTIPFADRHGAFVGAITLERSNSKPFDRSTVHVCDGVAALVGPILEEKRRADRPVVVSFWDSVRAFWKRLVGPRHALLKIITAAVVVAAAILAVAKGDFRVTAKTNLQGEIRRVASAPFRGFIRDATARAGDVVEEGQLLASLDDRDLRLEHTRWSTEREQHLLEQRKALAEGNLAAVKVLSKKMGQAEAQMALLDEQMARSRINAPFRGLVVSGDLSQSLGAPVDAGQVLFEIAPLDAYRLILQVDEWDIRYLEPGQRGNLILTAIPEERFPLTITKITPVAISEQGKTFFRVEGRLDESTDRLRPGMEGFAKVEIDRRLLAWIWTHDLIDWARLKIWTWLP